MECEDYLDRVSTASWCRNGCQAHPLRSRSFDTDNQEARPRSRAFFFSVQVASAADAGQLHMIAPALGGVEGSIRRCIARSSVSRRNRGDAELAVIVSCRRKTAKVTADLAPRDIAGHSRASSPFDCRM